MPRASLLITFFFYITYCKVQTQRKFPLHCADHAGNMLVRKKKNSPPFFFVWGGGVGGDLPHRQSAVSAKSGVIRMGRSRGGGRVGEALLPIEMHFRWSWLAGVWLVVVVSRCW